MKPRWWASPRSHPEALVLLVGAAGLTGWLFDLGVLKSISSSWSSMKANEAISFVLVGLALLLLAAPSGRYAGYVLAGLAGLTGLLTIGEYSFGSDFGIDELLFHDAGDAPGTGDPGRMSIDSAISFVVAGASIVLLDTRRAWRVRPAELGAVTIAALATLTIRAISSRPQSTRRVSPDRSCGSGCTRRLRSWC